MGVQYHIVKHKESIASEAEDVFSIYPVRWENGNPHSRDTSTHATTPQGDSPQSLLRDLTLMLEAFSRPILEIVDGKIREMGVEEGIIYYPCEKIKVSKPREKK